MTTAPASPVRPGRFAPRVDEAGFGRAVDEHRAELHAHLFLVPVCVGAGKGSLPGEARVDLELRDERRLGNGTVYLHYNARDK